MRFDIEFNSGAFYTPHDVIDLAQLAEERGFGGIWKGESNSTDAVVLLSAMAPVTRSLELGTAVTHIHARSPVATGIQAATLSDLTRGRFRLGLGVGNGTVAKWHDSEHDHLVGRIREYVEIVRLVASGRRVDFRGRYYSVEGFRLSWVPTHRDLPIYYGGLGQQMLSLAGRIADGVIMGMTTPDLLAASIAHVTEAARASGRDPERLRFLAKVRCAVHADRMVARDRLRRLLAYYSLLEYHRDVIASSGFASEVAAVADAFRVGGLALAARAVSDVMLDTLPTIAATSVAEVQDRAAAYLDAGATRVILTLVPCTPDPMAEGAAFMNSWTPAERPILTG